jgi:tRNA uridine 5-carbamoylmethylation protein Kti12
MDLDKEFQNVISKLKNNERPQLKYSKDEFSKLNEEWTKRINNEDFSQLFKLYCILDNTQNYSDIFCENIFKTFKLTSDSQTIIYNLSAASKHIIAYNHQLGNRVPHELVEQLKELLSHKDPEVLEWTLRTIEQLGSQAIFLKGDIIKAKPGILSIFDKHKKASKQIIEMLEKRWAPRDK